MKTEACFYQQRSWKVLTNTEDADRPFCETLNSYSTTPLTGVTRVFTIIWHYFQNLCDSDAMFISSKNRKIHVMLDVSMSKEQCEVEYGVTLQLRTEEVRLSSNVPGSFQFESWPRTMSFSVPQAKRQQSTSNRPRPLLLLFPIHYSVTILTLRL